MKEFIPQAVYYEEKTKDYPLGKELLKKYERFRNSYLYD